MAEKGGRFSSIADGVATVTGHQRRLLPAKQRIYAICLAVLVAGLTSAGGLNGKQRRDTKRECPSRQSYENRIGFLVL